MTGVGETSPPRSYDNERYTGRIFQLSLLSDQRVMIGPQPKRGEPENIVSTIDGYRRHPDGFRKHEVLELILAKESLTIYEDAVRYTYEHCVPHVTELWMTITIRTLRDFKYAHLYQA